MRRPLAVLLSTAFGALVVVSLLIALGPPQDVPYSFSPPLGATVERHVATDWWTGHRTLTVDVRDATTGKLLAPT